MRPAFVHLLDSVFSEDRKKHKMRFQVFFFFFFFTATHLQLLFCGSCSWCDVVYRESYEGTDEQFRLRLPVRLTLTTECLRSLHEVMTVT